MDFGAADLYFGSENVCLGDTRIRQTSVAPRRGALVHDFCVFKLSRVSELFVALRGRPKEASRAPLDVPRTSEMAQNGLPHMGTDFTQGRVLQFFVSVVYDVLVGWFLIGFWGSLSLFLERKCVLGGVRGSGKRAWRLDGVHFFIICMCLCFRVSSSFSGRSEDLPRRSRECPWTSPEPPLWAKPFPRTLRLPSVFPSPQRTALTQGLFVI